MEREYPVPEMPDYFVNEAGQVISRKHGKRRVLKTLYREARAGRGREQVCFTVITDDGYKKITKLVQQVVCAAKYGRWAEPWEQVRHLDSNKRNNRMDNLSYGCAVLNMIDDIENGSRQTSSEYIREAIERLKRLL